MDDLEIKESTEYPGYGASKDGRVWSRRKMGCTKRIGSQWKEMKQSVDKTGGYLRVEFQTENGRKLRPVHAFVLATFGATRPFGYDCRHINGVRTDNRFENLAWGTRSENMQDAIAHGTFSCGTRQPASKLTDDDVVDILKCPNYYGSGSMLSRKYGVTTSVISEVRSRKAWKHVVIDNTSTEGEAV